MQERILAFQRLRNQSSIADHFSMTTNPKGTSMKKILVTSFATGALASSALGLAGIGNAAPSGSPSVNDTVSELRAQGFEVVVNRIGSAPADQCTLGGVRP